jgi:hypothetical protein
MTTFTTEDRLIAEQNGSVTINVEPIPFAGIVTLTETVPKYRELTAVQIACIYQQIFGFKPMDTLSYQFALAILEKAQEK